MSYDPVVKEHQEWLGFLQPVGLVVSPTALKNAQARVARQATREQEILLRHTREVVDADGKTRRKLNRFVEFAQEFWGWESADLAIPPDHLSTALHEYGEVLRPDFAVPGVRGECDWQILIQELPPSFMMDLGGQTADERGWQASPQVRFERLLRDTGIPIGLLVHPDAIRLVYAPRGETAGHLTFPIDALGDTAGRPMVAALHLLLDQQRLFSLPKNLRLPAILQGSRKYQNEVSIQLAGQVLRALNELCRGFNEANRATGVELLKRHLAEAPEDVYGGLLTTLMRMVFLLYAEDRDLMASSEVYQRCYSLIGLHDKLREDAAAYPDTMDQRFGAWSQFLTLSQLVHDGGGHAAFHLPARRGRLFDPDTYPFLEGRPPKSHRSRYEKLVPPKVSDGVVFRVLDGLLFLEADGNSERISYRALDVEQIGSVYEAMMGFEVQQAAGPSIGFKPDHIVVNVGTLLAQPPADRKKWLKEHGDWEPAEKAAQALKAADSVDSILTALNTRISPLYTDRHRGTLAIAPGDIYLQPTEERRRSGSHYTPRSLTEPIVRTTLDPVLQQLGENPTPEQILSLKVCDPAMGSGAFLVEACRYLGDALVMAWAAHRSTPDIPTDQDPLLHARRIVAQRCLYGMDKNLFAVDLAKLSLWLATFAKDHPFTFLDHSFRHGDSLVGLGFQELLDGLGDGSTLFRPLAEARVAEAMKARKAILEAIEATPYDLLETRYRRSLESVGTLRDLGDAIVAAFFLHEKPKDRARRLSELAEAFDKGKFDVLAQAIHSLHIEKRLFPFHWETELPEVFEYGGFDAIVGNPPFLGGKRISGAFGKEYAQWLTSIHKESNGNADLVAHFFRRAFHLVRSSGCTALLATNTISQGDTRRAALRYIGLNGGDIFWAQKRIKWPGVAAVVVSAVAFVKGRWTSSCLLDSRPVSFISSFLIPSGSHSDPHCLGANKDLSFIGCDIKSQAFLFDDDDEEASSIAVKDRLLAANPRNEQVIRPYLGGAELNDTPRQTPTRWAISFADMSESIAREWPDVFRIVEEKVRPDRETRGRELAEWPFWQFWRPRLELYRAASAHTRILGCAQTSRTLAFSFLSPDIVFSQKVVLIVLPQMSAFSVLQSRIHQEWAYLFGSSLKDDPVYTPSDCFETFPFPPRWKENGVLAEVGEKYYEFRSELMIRNNEGLTDTYNRFQDKYEEDVAIRRFRDLQAQMDRAVLDAYGWTDLQPVHDFILDYEEHAEDESGNRRKRKEPWRYRWTDGFRDEVLARLLELNRQRAEEERQAAPAAPSAGPVRKRVAKKPKTIAAGQTAFDLKDDQ